MVKISDVRKSNSEFQLSGHSKDLVAVFVGATSGIGMGTLKQFAKYSITPKVYIIGRSKKAAQPLLDELKASNKDGDFEFVETEVSLIKNVVSVCDQIKAKETKVDILFMSPGFLAFGPRQESSEGIDIPHALRYYTRLAFVNYLLPLLLAAPLPRVISILAGGQESAIDTTDLEVKNDFTFMKAAGNGTTQTTLAFEELSKSHPTITFIHKYPGFVNSGVLSRLLSTATFPLSIPATAARYLIVPLINLLSTSIDEAGERGVFLATSARFPPGKPRGEYVGQMLPAGVDVAEPSVVRDGVGNGVYRLGAHDDSAGPSAVLEGYRREKVDELVWEETKAVFERALARA